MPEPYRICVLAACPFPANHGTPGSIREIVEGLAARGHEVHLVTYPHGEDIAVEGVHIHRVSGLFGEDRVTVGPTNRKPIYDFLMVLKAIRVCWKYRIQVMHAHLYEAAIAAWMTRWFSWVPFVYSAHNTMQDELASYDFFRWKWFANTLARFLDWFVPARANRCVPHSLNIEKFLHSQGLEKRCSEVVSFGIDIEDVDRRRAAIAEGSFADLTGPVICYTGILDNFQRLDLLLEAVRLTAIEHPEVTFAVGMSLDQPEFRDKLQSMADELGIGRNVVFTDRLSFDQCLALLERADIAVSPRPETPGFPIKLLNYFAMEKPVVMFESSASGITHQQHAWLADSDTAESLADGLKSVLSDSNLAARMAAGGREFVQQEHNRDAVASKLERVFASVIDPKGSQSLVPEIDGNKQPGHEEPKQLVGATAGENY